MSAFEVAGIFGILASVALTGEFVFFGRSGFAQSTFNNPATAIAFLRDHGIYIRTAPFGAAGIVLLERIFVVMSGGTLGAIARRGGKSLGQMAAANLAVNDPNGIVAGECLLIPD